MGGGVVKVHVTALASVPPVADLVPAGISAVYLVAIGKRTVGSNISVFVPTQRHLPAGCGESLTGTASFARSCRLVSATIGWLNVTLRYGASGTSPSGWKRKTSSGPLSGAPTGLTAGAGGGNGSWMVWPGRGAGCEAGRIANSTASPVAAGMAGRREMTCATAASGSGWAGATVAPADASGCSAPSLSRTGTPGMAVGVALATAGVPEAVVGPGLLALRRPDCAGVMLASGLGAGVSVGRAPHAATTTTSRASDNRTRARNMASSPSVAPQRATRNVLAGRARVGLG